MPGGKALGRSSQQPALKPVAGLDIDALADLTEFSYIDLVRWTGLQAHIEKRRKLSPPRKTRARTICRNILEKHHKEIHDLQPDPLFADLTRNDIKSEIVCFMSLLPFPGRPTVDDMSDFHHIAFLVVEGFQSMDLFGPVDAFDATRELGGPEYRIDIATLANRSVATEAGIRVSATARLQDLETIDTLVLCGGTGARIGRLSPDHLEAVAETARRARRVVSICTGAFLLARAGLASGRRVATHWRYADELQNEFPEARVDGDAIFLRDGPVWSSAGVTAGIDLSLALIAEDCGQPVAAAVARQLVIYMRRAGNQAQYSDPLQIQGCADERFAELVAWMTNHLAEPMTVEMLAGRVALTPRHFTRLFRERFGVTPGRYVENLRLDRARSLLDEGRARIDQVASAVGYASDVAFRRAFERRFEMTPTQYRRRFAPASFN